MKLSSISHFFDRDKPDFFIQIETVLKFTFNMGIEII